MKSLFVEELNKNVAERKQESFLQQTSKDYDFPIHVVRTEFNLADDLEDFYNRLEELIGDV